VTDLYAQAEAEWDRGHQVDQTVVQLDAALVLEPNHVRALAFSGWLRTTHRPAEFELGLAQLLRALELGTDDSRVAANVADALASAKRGREALEPVRRWCEAHPLEPAGWNALGWLLGVTLGEHAKGLEALDRALSVSPWFANARLNRARVRLALQQLDPAEADLHVALRGDCWRPHEVLVRLGEVAAARGQLRRALGFFRRAVERDTRGEYSLSLHQAVQALGSVLLQQGRYFLHVHEDSVRVQRLERPAPAAAPLPLSALVARAQTLRTVPALEETCAGVVACAEAQQLLPAFADHSFALQLEQHGGEAARRLAADWRVAQLALYDELLMREEGAPTPFERALSQRDWAAAKALVLADADAEQRLGLAERLGDRLAMLGDERQARELWQVAHAAAREFASWATAGGEGLARMADVERLEARLR
jgi:tetratricopeptide (TPR) repeat protein